MVDRLSGPRPPSSDAKRVYKFDKCVSSNATAFDAAQLDNSPVR